VCQCHSLLHMPCWNVFTQHSHYPTFSFHIDPAQKSAPSIYIISWPSAYRDKDARFRQQTTSVITGKSWMNIPDPWGRGPRRGCDLLYVNVGAGSCLRSILISKTVFIRGFIKGSRWHNFVSKNWSIFVAVTIQDLEDAFSGLHEYDIYATKWNNLYVLQRPIHVVTYGINSRGGTACGDNGYPARYRNLMSQVLQWWLLYCWLLDSMIQLLMLSVEVFCLCDGARRLSYVRSLFLTTACPPMFL
jgi:hypothetical protein